MKHVELREDRFQLNISALDGWTFVHVAFGFTFGVLRVPRPVAYSFIVGTELVELFLRKMLPFFRESTANIFTDLLVGVAAYELGRAFTT